MLITLDPSLTGDLEVDLEVAPGTPLWALMEHARAEPESVAGPWCGVTLVGKDHPAGSWPLVDGARLSAGPRQPSAPLKGPHLAAIAGPDAGKVFPLTGTLTLVRSARDQAEPGPDRAGIDDQAVSAAHASVQLLPARQGRADASAVVRSLAAANGAQSWRHKGRDWHRPWRRAKATISAGDVIVAGRTALALRGGDVPADDLSKPAAGTLGPKMAGMAGGAISAIMLAAITGRWYLAALALVFPAIVFLPRALASLAPCPAPPWVLLPDPTGATPSQEWDGSVSISGPAAQGFARAVVLARARRPPAGSFNESWMARLEGPRAQDGRIIIADGPQSWADVSVAAFHDHADVCRHGVSVRTLPCGVSVETADAASRRIASAAGAATLPSAVRWADVSVASTAPRAARLSDGSRSVRAVIGAVCGPGGTLEPWELDLDEHGPHLLVAGTTGSGKSALLETMVLSLALALPPSELSFVLMDFKGGAGLRTCLGLPHVRGSVTDLDGDASRRALVALASELKHRKESLSERGLSSFAEWEREGGCPPRLIVVVDEFQEIGALHREFVPDVTRLAAQGRSLGMHLVLATQRPAGAVTAEIRANVSTTIALRVASEAESRDLIGTPDAAGLDPSKPGRAIVSAAGTRLPIQVALPIAEQTPAVQRLDSIRHDGAHLASRVPPHEGPRRPLWLPPLPTAISVAELDALAAADVLQGLDARTERLATGMARPGARPTIQLGLGDWPHERRQGPVGWKPDHGPLVISGPAGSGRSALLRWASVACSAAGLRCVWLPAEPREAARTLSLLASSPEAVLLVDDAVSALGRLEEVDRGIGRDLLLSRAAGGGRVAMVVPAQVHHRLAANVGALALTHGTSTTDDAMWEVPAQLDKGKPIQSRVRWRDRSGWCAAQLGCADAASAEHIVKRLPTSPRDALDLVKAAKPCAEGAIVGIGGDQALPVTVPPGCEVFVVGSPGPQRSDLCAALTEAGALVTAVDLALALPRERSRDCVVVVMSPTPRSLDEAGAYAVGIADARPIEGRVAWIQGGIVQSVQIAYQA